MLRCLSILMTSIFFVNVVFGYSSEVNFWAERQKNQLVSLPAGFNSALLPQTQISSIASSLRSSTVPSWLKTTFPKGSESSLIPIIRALPQTMGIIRKVSVPIHANGRTVIHIQDVHRNHEAQDNIGAAVQELINHKVVDLVALEGAFTPLDFSWARAYPYQDVIKAVADYLDREMRITGPIYSAFTSKVAIPTFVGVDERAHYNANIEAYRQSAPLVASYKRKLNQKMQELNKAKAAIFNPRLRDFDAHITFYRQGTLSWGKYVQLLSYCTSNFSAKVNAFLAALELEAKLNFSQIESERTRLINQLVPKLTKLETDELLTQSTGYRLGNLSHSDFYSYLKQLCHQKGLLLSKFHGMDNYIRYVLLCDSLDVEAILKEAAITETNVYQSLAKTGEEHQLIQESRLNFLMSKLLDFSLTKDEWVEYSKLRRDNYFGQSLGSFEAFYTEAEARDEAMTLNLETAMHLSDGKVAVLVTGGFHAEGMSRRLQSKGFTVISYVPKINKVEDEWGSAYLSMFTQQKTPLDKLFSGEKLFLAGSPIPVASGIESLVGAKVAQLGNNPGHLPHFPVASYGRIDDGREGYVESLTGALVKVGGQGLSISDPSEEVATSAQLRHWGNRVMVAMKTVLGISVVSIYGVVLSKLELPWWGLAIIVVFSIPLLSVLLAVIFRIPIAASLESELTPSSHDVRGYLIGKLKETLGDRFQFYPGGFASIDITLKGINKNLAIQDLLQNPLYELGIYFGDEFYQTPDKSGNDTPLLQARSEAQKGGKNIVVFSVDENPDARSEIAKENTIWIGKGPDATREVLMAIRDGNEKGLTEVIVHGKGPDSDKTVTLFLEQLKNKGFMAFDVDGTILAKKADNFSNEPKIRGLFAQLLNNGFAMNIISGNSSAEQRDRISDQLKGSEVLDQIDVMTNLRLYVNGGASRLSFDAQGNHTLTNLSGSISTEDIQKVVSVIAQEAQSNFGLWPEEVDAWKTWHNFDGEYGHRPDFPNVRFAMWWTDPAFHPSVNDAIAIKEASKAQPLVVTGPFIEARDGVQLSIKLFPKKVDIASKQASKEITAEKETPGVNNATTKRSEETISKEDPTKDPLVDQLVASVHRWGLGFERLAVSDLIDRHKIDAETGKRLIAVVREQVARTIPWEKIVEDGVTVLERYSSHPELIADVFGTFVRNLSEKYAPFIDPDFLRQQIWSAYQQQRNQQGHVVQPLPQKLLHDRLMEFLKQFEEFKDDPNDQKGRRGFISVGLMASLGLYTGVLATFPKTGVAAVVAFSVIFLASLTWKRLLVPLGTFVSRFTESIFLHSNRDNETQALQKVVTALLEGLEDTDPAKRIIKTLPGAERAGIWDMISSASRSAQIEAKVRTLLQREAQRQGINLTAIAPEQLASVAWAVLVELRGNQPNALVMAEAVTYTLDSTIDTSKGIPQEWVREANSLLQQSQNLILVGSEEQTENLKRMMGLKADSRVRIATTRDQTFKKGIEDLNVVVTALATNPQAFSSVTILFGRGYSLESLVAKQYQGRGYRILPRESYKKGWLWDMVTLNVASQMEQAFKNLIYA